MLKTKIITFFLLFIFFNTKAQSVLETQKMRFEATIARDSAELERFLSKELFYIHSNALTETKNQHIQTILKQKIVYQSFEYLEAPTVLYKKKTAILNGKLLVKGLYNGNPFETKFLFTAIYEKKNRHWQLLRWQSTKIP